MIQEAYELWRRRATEDPDLQEELASITDDPDAQNDRFYRDLEFGTGGLRGVIGAGSNRMNVYTVRRATQGLANFVRRHNERGSVAISYDSRIKSDMFARAAAEVLAASGIHVHLYSHLAPTPMLSFTVRYLRCDAGIMVTASHNPAIYNGYKAYGPDGAQLGLDASVEVIREVEAVDIFDGVRRMDFDSAVRQGLIEYIKPEIEEAFFRAVLAQSVRSEICRETDLSVVYTPLYGTGNHPVRTVLARAGIRQVTAVPEQELPDGTFPTTPFPNPEIRQVFECALAMASTTQPDLLLATDPDCDRVGIAVRRDGEYQLLTGNEVGALLLDYVLAGRKERGTLPKDPLAITTIVSTHLATDIAQANGCGIEEVLTGFKFIGERITALEAERQAERFVFGFEESYGYLAGTYARDKDAVVAALLICEMAAYYKKSGITLVDKLQDLYARYGYYTHTQLNFTCEGMEGMAEMRRIMAKLRECPPMSIAGYTVRSVADYGLRTETDCATGAAEPLTLPESDVLSYRLGGGLGVVVRPSGTEPKIKVYITAKAEDMAAADMESAKMKADVTKMLGF